MTKKKILLVIIPDRLSDLVNKGEVTERYYNPGNLFDEVHIMMTNDDKPNPDLVKPMVGRAKLVLHNYPEPPGFFKKTLGWRPWLMNCWAKGTIDVAKQINPNLIRCHGAHLNAFLAAKIKKALGVPYIISLHINPEADIRRHPKKEMSSKDHFIYKMSRAMEKISISNADCIVGVYNWIKPYAEEYGAQGYKTIYNVIPTTHIVKKNNYEIIGAPKCILPGRQFSKKDPSEFLRVMVDIPELKATVVGHGPYHNKIVTLAQNLGISNRVTFYQSMTNKELCKVLPEHDFLLSVNEYGGISKVELEAAFTGMPIITNKNLLEGKPEILEDNALTYSNIKELERCIKTLLSDPLLRKNIGTNLRSSVQHLTGDKTEKQYADLYDETMRKSTC